jgi:flagellar hook-basal body complex protein FliE
MAVGAVGGIGAGDPSRLYGAAGQASAPRASFADTLRSALQEVNSLQTRRDEVAGGLVAGTVQEPHDVMVATEEAQLAFELMLEVRNRLLESYQEVMRMQV